MNRKGIYGILLIIGFGISGVLCQTADSLYCDTNVYTIVLDCEPTLDSTFLENGDQITVLAYVSDYSWQRNSISYLNDSINSLPIESSLAIGSSPAGPNLEFSIYSKSKNCKSGKVEYITDTLNSTECVLYVSSFNAFNHRVLFPEKIICTGDEAFTLDSDIPDSNFTISSNSLDLKISEDGKIVPRESIPGIYTVNIQSDYCLESNSIDIEIGASKDLALKDTLSFCSGADPVVTAPDMSDIQFYGSGDSESTVLGEIPASGYYVAVGNEGPCASIDTVYVELVEPPEFILDTQEECDRVIVRTTIPDNRNYTVSWSNEAEGIENVVFNDTYLYVTVSDESGCSDTASIKVTVNRLAVRSVDSRKEDADCWTDGKLAIDAAIVDNSIGNYRYRLYNDLTHQAYSDLDEIEIPEGVYTLQVIDDNNCIADWEQKVKVEQKCLEDYPAFSPDGDNIEDDYFIPHEGTVSIYNRDGILIKKLETPAYWDGTDELNRLLPMGNYLIVTDTGRPVNITIVR